MLRKGLLISVPGQYDPPPPKSGGTSVLKIVLIVLAVLIIGCGGLCAGCLVIAKGLERRSRHPWKKGCSPYSSLLFMGRR